MTSKERMECVFSGEKPDRYPCFEHFWSETIVRWRDEGFPADADSSEYFGFDIASVGGFDLSAQLPGEQISEDGTYRITRDSRGVTAKHHKSESGHTPQWLDTPIKEHSDWWGYKENLAFNVSRVDQNSGEYAKRSREKGKYSCIFIADPYEQAWPVFGQANILMAMLESPKIVKDAMDTWANLTVECLDNQVQNQLDFDGVFMYGDMGYRNGTLFSPDNYRQLVLPAHKKIASFVHENGKKLILHSCGQVKGFIPMLIEVGFDALQPIEAKCNQDVRELVKQYGRQIVFFGNMDVRELSKNKEAIRQEVESKLAAFDSKWNYIFHSDHSVPPTVSFENYCYAIDLVKNYI